MDANIVITQARKYVGTPFLHQGRTDKGLDCVGLIARVAKDLNLSNYDFLQYNQIPNPILFMSILRSCPDWDRISIQEITVGDVLVLKLSEYPCHLAFLATESRIIHALSLRGRVCEHRLSSDWRRKIRDCFRFKGVI